MQLQDINFNFSMPRLYSQHGVNDPSVHARFHVPDSNYTWYAVEGSPDGKDFNFFGYCLHPFPQPCFFSLSELTRIGQNLGKKIVVDVDLTPKRLSQVEGVLVRHQAA